jgi:Uma2 family endonuclease
MRPMSAPEFLALGETRECVELFDGSLHVTSRPNVSHQRISRELANALDDGAHRVRLQVLEAINLQLRPSRITIPDIVLTSPDIDLDSLTVDASAVSLVCEITSPSNATTDKVLKKHYYAEAGIPWYLLVDAQAGRLHLYELSGNEYLEHSAGEVLRLTEPIVATLDPARLLPPR